MQYPVVIFLVVLILARRIQRATQFQKYNQAVMIIRVVLFGLISLGFLFYCLFDPLILVWDMIGIAGGLALAYVATNHAKFEKRENGLYYKTHVWVEITVIVLFIARIGYRLIVFKNTLQDDPVEDRMQANIEYLRNPLSGIILYAFFTYYIGYFSFVLKEAGKALRKQ